MRCVTTVSTLTLTLLKLTKTAATTIKTSRNMKPCMSSKDSLSETPDYLDEKELTRILARN